MKLPLDFAEVQSAREDYEEAKARFCAKIEIIRSFCKFYTANGFGSCVRCRENKRCELGNEYVFMIAVAHKSSFDEIVFGKYFSFDEGDSSEHQES